jgi:hypothetical protein
VTSLDDLELELRRLPGVRAAGFDDRGDLLVVQLQVAAHEGEQPVPMQASRIAARHCDRPVAVEVVRWRTLPDATAAAPIPPPIGLTERRGAEAAAGAATGESAPVRPRLLAVLAFPDADELEVHLTFEGRRTIGRAEASRGLVGAAEATIGAVGELGATTLPTVRWARAVDDTDDDRIVVAVALGDVSDGTVEPSSYGLAAGASPIDAAARAALDALNRRLTLVL